MSDFRKEIPHEMRQDPHRNWSESGDEDPSLNITRGGRGVNLNWKALLGIITAAIMATIYCVNLVNKVDAHTAAIGVLTVDVHEVNIKVNALLRNRGLSPRVVVKEAAEESAADAAAVK